MEPHLYPYDCTTESITWCLYMYMYIYRNCRSFLLKLINFQTVPDSLFQGWECNQTCNRYCFLGKPKTITDVTQVTSIGAFPAPVSYHFLTFMRAGNKLIRGYKANEKSTKADRLHPQENMWTPSPSPLWQLFSGKLWIKWNFTYIFMCTLHKYLLVVKLHKHAIHTKTITTGACTTVSTNLTQRTMKNQAKWQIMVFEPVNLLDNLNYLVVVEYVTCLDTSSHYLRVLILLIASQYSIKFTKPLQQHWDKWKHSTYPVPLLGDWSCTAQTWGSIGGSVRLWNPYIWWERKLLYCTEHYNNIQSLCCTLHQPPKPQLKT